MLSVVVAACAGNVFVSVTMTPDPLEAAIAAWVPKEAVQLVKTALCSRHAEYDELCEGCVGAVLAAYQQAIAPLLARAVEAAIRCDGVAHDTPGALCANCGTRDELALDPDRLSAFLDVLTQAKPEGRGR